ncbi:hypothetical protein, partial [uncultured Paenibacillus sp.]|uniref:hypothetical protein n=1 Tax=uncultured Paenibacillus sp. TaxID=227322 RepID=UPI0025EFECA4
GRAEEIAAILQEFRLNESPSRGIAANLHHFRPFCFKPKRNGGNSCNFAGFPFWNSRPYRIAVFLQDFAYRIGVPGKIVEFADFACRMGVSREMVQFSGWWKYPFSYSKLLSQQPDPCNNSAEKWHKQKEILHFCRISSRQTWQNCCREACTASHPLDLQYFDHAGCTKSLL